LLFQAKKVSAWNIGNRNFSINLRVKAVIRKDLQDGFEIVHGFLVLTNKHAFYDKAI